LGRNFFDGFFEGFFFSLFPGAFMFASSLLL